MSCATSAGAVELPVLEQGGQARPVPGERDVLSAALVGGAEAEQVEHIHAEALGQTRSDASPRPRRPRCAVHQHHRRPLTESVPGDVARVGGKALTQDPLAHRKDGAGSVARDGPDRPRTTHESGPPPPGTAHTPPSPARERTHAPVQSCSLSTLCEHHHHRGLAVAMRDLRKRLLRHTRRLPIVLSDSLVGGSRRCPLSARTAEAASAGAFIRLIEGGRG